MEPHAENPSGCQNILARPKRVWPADKAIANLIKGVNHGYNPTLPDLVNPLEIYQMTTILSRIPAWADDALQGITFWIGHRRAMYRHHELTEGAIVAELANLISHRLVGDDNQKTHLYCEVLYRNVLTDKEVKASKESWGGTRLDLLVASESVSRPQVRTHDFSTSVTQVIEVKRALPQSKITGDLQRLANLVVAKPSVRAFLIVVAEARIPKPYAGPSISKDKRQDVRAQTGRHVIEGTDCYFMVKRVCKASASFKSFSNAHYACLIEVLPTKKGAKKLAKN